MVEAVCLKRRRIVVDRQNYPEASMHKAFGNSASATEQVCYRRGALSGYPGDLGPAKRIAEFPDFTSVASGCLFAAYLSAMHGQSTAERQTAVRREVMRDRSSIRHFVRGKKLAVRPQPGEYSGSMIVQSWWAIRTAACCSLGIEESQDPRDLAEVKNAFVQRLFSGL